MLIDRGLPAEGSQLRDWGVCPIPHVGIGVSAPLSCLLPDVRCATFVQQNPAAELASVGATLTSRAKRRRRKEGLNPSAIANSHDPPAE